MSKVGGRKEAVEGLLINAAGRPTNYIVKTGTGERLVMDIDAEAFSDGCELARRFRLTPQQARTVQLLYGRRTNREIAFELGVTENTARRHVEAALGKLGTSSRYDVERILIEAALERTGQRGGRNASTPPMHS